ncbi:MAG: hypothetical protein AAF939_04545 [Planctomycetota bacterium]
MIRPPICGIVSSMIMRWTGAALEVKVTGARIDGAHSPGAYINLQYNPNDPSGGLASLHMNALPKLVWTGVQSPGNFRGTEFQLTSELRFVDNEGKWIFENDLEEIAAEDFLNWNSSGWNFSHPIFPVIGQRGITNLVEDITGNQSVEMTFRKNEDRGTVYVRSPDSIEGVSSIEASVDLLLETPYFGASRHKVIRLVAEDDAGYHRHEFIVQLENANPLSANSPTYAILSSNGGSASGRYGMRLNLSRGYWAV